MRFGDWIKLVLLTIACLVAGAFIGGATGAGAGPTAGVFVGLLIAFGGPWMFFLMLSHDAKCKECGKKWSLEKNGFEDGDISELHERNNKGEMKLVHKWDRYQHWKCKHCGNETIEKYQKTKTV